MTLTTKILARDNHCCAYCGGYADTIDHLIPKAERRRHGIADDDERYLVACCLTDNLLKGTRRIVPMDYEPFGQLPGTRPWMRWNGDPRELGRVLR